MNFSLSIHDLRRHLLVLGPPVAIDLFVLSTSSTIWTTLSRGRHGPGMSFGAGTCLMIGIGLAVYGAAPVVEFGAGRWTRTPTEAERRVASWMMRDLGLLVLYGWSFYITKCFL